MTAANTSVSFKSPLYQMTETTPTCLWNDSADLDELKICDGAWRRGGHLQSSDCAHSPHQGRSDLAPTHRVADQGFRSATEDQDRLEGCRKSFSTRAAKLPRTRLRGSQRPKRSPVHSDRPPAIPGCQRRSLRMQSLSTSSRRT